MEFIKRIFSAAGFGVSDYAYMYTYVCKRCNTLSTATEHDAMIWDEAPECYKQRMCLRCWWDTSAN